MCVFMCDCLYMCVFVCVCFACVCQLVNSRNNGLIITKIHMNDLFDICNGIFCSHLEIQYGRYHCSQNGLIYVKMNVYINVRFLNRNSLNSINKLLINHDAERSTGNYHF